MKIARHFSAGLFSARPYGTQDGHTPERGAEARRRMVLEDPHPEMLFLILMSNVLWAETLRRMVSNDSRPEVPFPSSWVVQSGFL